MHRPIITIRLSLLVVVTFGKSPVRSFQNVVHVCLAHPSVFWGFFTGLLPLRPSDRLIGYGLFPPSSPTMFWKGKHKNIPSCFLRSTDRSEEEEVGRSHHVVQLQPFCFSVCCSSRDVRRKMRKKIFLEEVLLLLDRGT